MTADSKDPQELVALLSNPDGETRAAAAAELRQLIAASPDARTNDHGEEYWKKYFDSIPTGMKYSDFIKLLPDSAHCIMVNYSGRSGAALWRLDHYWLAHIYYKNRDIVFKSPQLSQKAMEVWIKPPEDFTGTWVTWHVNGQKSNESDYKDGKRHGSFTAFHDNGQKAYQHHHNGPATGWHRDCSNAYIGINKDGKPEGTWIFWNEDGSVDTIEYKNGVYVP